MALTEEQQRLIKQQLRAAYDIGYNNGSRDGEQSCSRYVPGNVETVMGNALISALNAAPAQAEPSERKMEVFGYVDSDGMFYRAEHGPAPFPGCTTVYRAARRPARSRTVTTAPAAALDQLRSRIKEMQEAAYTFGDYSKEAVSVALDGVLEAIDELPVAE